MCPGAQAWLDDAEAAGDAAGGVTPRSQEAVIRRSLANPLLGVESRLHPFPSQRPNLRCVTANDAALVDDPRHVEGQRLQREPGILDRLQRPFSHAGPFGGVGQLLVEDEIGSLQSPHADENRPGGIHVVPVTYAQRGCQVEDGIGPGDRVSDDLVDGRDDRIHQRRPFGRTVISVPRRPELLIPMLEANLACAQSVARVQVLGRPHGNDVIPGSEA
jgi:hypothetical protein